MVKINEDKKGKWIEKKADFLLYGLPVIIYKCPYCSTEWKERLKFCGECGADMRESEVASNDIDNY